MNLKYKTHYISEEDYLKDEKTREIKHEYINGEIYAMAGASWNHNELSLTVARFFGNHLEDTRCRVFVSDMKVRIETRNSMCFFYPDVLVTCENRNPDNYVAENPIIIIEVLSKSTRKFDQTLKFDAYKALPSLHEYVLIEQDFAEVEVCRRENHWISERYFLGDEVTFKSIDLTVSVEAIYKRVQNEDVLEFLEAKEKEAS